MDCNGSKHILLFVWGGRMVIYFNSLQFCQIFWQRQDLLQLYFIRIYCNCADFLPKNGFITIVLYSNILQFCFFFSFFFPKTGFITVVLYSNLLQFRRFFLPKTGLITIVHYSNLLHFCWYLAKNRIYCNCTSFQFIAILLICLPITGFITIVLYSNLLQYYVCFFSKFCWLFCQKEYLL